VRLIIFQELHHVGSLVTKGVEPRALSQGLDAAMWFAAWVTAAALPELTPIEVGMLLLRIEAKAPRRVYKPKGAMAVL